MTSGVEQAGALAMAELKLRQSSPTLPMFGALRTVLDAAREPGGREVPTDVVIGPVEGVSAGRLADVIVPAAIAAKRALRIEVRGATHGHDAPAFPFFRYALQRALGRLGFDIGFELSRADFGEAGRLFVHTRPRVRKSHWAWGHPGRFVSLRCEILIGRQPLDVAQTQLRVLREHLHSAGWPLPAVTVREADDTTTPGNAVTVRAICTAGEAVFTAVAAEGDDPSDVAAQAASRAMGWLTSGTGVQRRLARRLVVPMALASGGRFISDGRDDPHLLRLVDTVTAAPNVACRLTRHRGRLLVEMTR
ncbi:MAG: RNA 3'-terminal phosphate cyclase [Planctomycetota bacterium]